MTPLLTRIREKVIAAQPERNWCVCWDDAENPTVCEVWDTINLADILLAMPLEIEVKHEPNHLLMRRTFGFEKAPTDWAFWDLRSDDLEKQSPECWEFIGEILGVHALAEEESSKA